LPAGLFNPDSKTIADGFVQSRHWLLRLNDYRSAAGLQLVEEDPQWSQAAANHARYLTETYGERLKAGHPPTLAEMHHENPQNRWYSPKSALAAQTGDEAMLPFRFDPVIAIDGWIIAPFHRPALLMGTLMHVGYGPRTARRLLYANLITRKHLTRLPSVRDTNSRSGFQSLFNWAGHAFGSRVILWLPERLLKPGPRSSQLTR
jgi:hypothetical protein